MSHRVCAKASDMCHQFYMIMSVKDLRKYLSHKLIPNGQFLCVLLISACDKFEGDTFKSYKYQQAGVIT